MSLPLSFFRLLVQHITIQFLKKNEPVGLQFATSIHDGVQAREGAG
jgi:hypothetical protein